MIFSQIIFNFFASSKIESITLDPDSNLMFLDPQHGYSKYIYSSTGTRNKVLNLIYSTQRLSVYFITIFTLGV